MRLIYEEVRVPVQIRRLMVFDEICRLAKVKPNEIVHLSPYTQLAFGVIYLKDLKRCVAFGSVFKYAHTRQEVIEQGLDKQFHEDTVMCAITTERQAFTKASRTPLGLLMSWNKQVKNRAYTCLDGNVKHFFKVNDELELDYPPHKFYGRLVAAKGLPLWDDKCS
ncbi:hypothetical protein [Psychrobacter aquimaris]|uniref:hypothetical protein n=1 Tax=Psychrobacter aquimaris TaxID=292733 RepID=UPI0039C5CBCA